MLLILERGWTCCLLLVARYFLSVTRHFLLVTCYLFACCSLLFARCSLLFARCLLLFARCSLVFVCCSSLFARCSLLFARCLLFFACCSLLFTRCSLLFAPVCNFLLVARYFCLLLFTFYSLFRTDIIFRIYIKHGFVYKLLWRVFSAYFCPKQDGIAENIHIECETFRSYFLVMVKL